MDKLKYIKLENEDGSYSSSIPLAVDSDYVDVNGISLTNKISSLATKDETSTLQSEISSLASGSPAGVYSTVAALTSADPDHSKIYVVIADGKWYYYNGNGWSAGGDYQIPLSADDNYDIDMFKNFISTLENSNDVTGEIPDVEWTEDYYYNKQNVLTTFSGAKCCDLTVIPGDMWHINGYTPGSAWAWFLLDANNNIIKHSTDGINSDSIVIPINAIKMRVNFFPSRPQKIQKMTSFIMNFETAKILLNKMGMDLIANDLLYGASYFDNKIWTQGELVDYTGFKASEKIKIPDNVTNLHLPTSYPTTLIDFFDEDKNFIVQKGGTSTSDPDSPIDIDLTNSRYEGAKYFGINIWYGNPTTQKVEINTGDSNVWKIVVPDEPIPDNSTTVDLFMFMGQSNMCGQGNPTLAPTLIEGAGWEYRASSNTIFPIAEPFGAVDNGATNGSLATAFANAYYSSTEIPIVGCMCAVSGSGIDEWQPDTVYLNRAVSRLEACKNYLTSNNYKIRNINMLWLQGEHEGMRDISAESYKQSFDNLFTVMKSHGVKNAFIIRIGEHNVASGADFSTIIRAQTEMCQDNKDIIMATTTLCSMADRHLMNDEFHFNQIALNEAGDYSGRNVAYFLTTGKEPTMYDYKYDDLYYSKIN